MGKTKVFHVKNEYDGDLGGDYLRGQELYEVDGQNEIPVYSVWNLCDCPEDAIVDRSLFSAYDYVRAVEYGMELAKQGYDSVSVMEVE